MRIAHVTDPHLVPPGATLFGLDSMARFDAALQHIERDFSNVDLCVLTGDLSDTADVASYRLLRERLATFPIKVRLLLGNHDDRRAFLKVFGDVPTDGSGFVQSFDDVGDARLIYLDTLESGAFEGRLCARRLAWLRDTLEDASDRDVFVFTHYPFLPFGIPHFRGMLLGNPHDVMPMLRAHGRVRHIFCGHAHIATTGHWGNIPFSISAGTAHHIVPNFLDHDARFVAMTPQFDIATFSGNTNCIHRIEARELPTLAVSKGV